MNTFTPHKADEFYPQIYDAITANWPGEMSFYHQMAENTDRYGTGVLELGCGTGRVAIRLARENIRVIGIDQSEAMLAVAETKSEGVNGVRWILGDMRSFELDEPFGLILLPGYSFHYMLTLEDQLDCLESVRRHLSIEGRVVVHARHPQLRWLESLDGTFYPEEPFTHPLSRQQIRPRQAWDYRAASQTLVSHTVWEEVNAGGVVTDHWAYGPVETHCLFPYETAHLLARVGLEVEAVYGDFSGSPLYDAASEMIWVAKHA